jgi:copper(I)-binding protein
MNATMTRRGFAGMIGGAVVVLAGSRLAFAHGNEDPGTPQANGTPMAMPMHGGGTGAAWFTITNNGDTDDRLVSADSDVAAAVEIHEMALKDGTMTMSPLMDGLAIPAGETVVLEPGGYHIMLIGLTRDLIAGESFELTLTFETAGEIELTVPIFMTKNAAAAAELETVEFGDLVISDIWSRHAPALMGDSATPMASPSN